MPFDGLFTYSMVNELKENIMGGRIMKIHQPYPNEIILSIRSKGTNHKLLLSAHPTYARAQLTRETYANPPEPPMFCMILRKHLEGFFIELIEQKDCDRIIIFKVKGRDELGDESFKLLIIEIMGRHSNIVLVDKAKGTIIDCIKHVSPAVNRYRTILPGQPYIWPPEQNKMNPFSATEEDVIRLLDYNAGKLDRQLVEQFAGISPVFAKEVLIQCGIANRITLPKTFINLITTIKKGEISPTIIRGDKEHFYLFPLKSVKGDIQTYSSLSELLDDFYFGKAERDRVKQIAGDLEKWVRNEIDKLEKKIKILERTIQEGKNSDVYQLYGELLTANMYQMEKGMSSITVQNYYDENHAEIEIPLDPQKTPSENAQAYFRKYNKGKHAVKAASEQIKIAKEELFYFEGLLQQIENASPKDIEEIKEELQEGGYIKAKKEGKRKKKTVPISSNIEKFIASDGTPIFVGKNNKQNDFLTMKMANKEHIWLHTKDIPGSHVVIQHPEPSEKTLFEGAILAAYFSKARNSSSVPVDYTKVKFVKKPSGAKPGFVIYKRQKTIYVTPKVDVVTRLKKQIKQ